MKRITYKYRVNGFKVRNNSSVLITQIEKVLERLSSKNLIDFNEKVEIYLETNSSNDFINDIIILEITQITIDN